MWNGIKRLAALLLVALLAGCAGQMARRVAYGPATEARIITWTVDAVGFVTGSRPTECRVLPARPSVIERLAETKRPARGDRARLWIDGGIDRISLAPGELTALQETLRCDFSALEASPVRVAAPKPCPPCPELARIAAGCAAVRIAAGDIARRHDKQPMHAGIAEAVRILCKET